MRLEPDEPVRLDPRLTAAALAHLLENAAHYAPPGSTIEVSAQTGPNGFRVDVRDHGSGIGAADLPHLFERFYRGAKARNGRRALAWASRIVRGLVAAAGGRVWGENAPDGGAVFTMVVPADVRAGSPEPADV